MSAAQTPWRQRFSDVEGRRFPQTVIEDAHGNAVTQVYWHQAQEDWTEVAQRIVQRVNAHDGLVAALREYDEAFSSFDPASKPDRDRMRKAVISARAALRAAAGATS